MPVSRQDVVDTLAVQDPAALRAILEAAGVSPRKAQTSRELGERLTSALWWSHCTPLGLAIGRTHLDDIVRHVGRKLRVHDQLGDGDAWTQLRQLALALAVRHGPVGFGDLDPEVRKRLHPSWWPPSLYAAGSGSSFGAAALGKVIVRVGKGPIGRLLPYIPYLGPWWGAIRRGGGAAAVVGGPLGLAFAVLSVNSALGANYQKLVPILLGLGALGPDPVDEAMELPPEE